MPIGTAAAALAGGTALAAYLNAKFHISKDLSSIARVRQAQKTHDNAAAKGLLDVWFIFDEVVKKYPTTTCIWSREGVYTFQEVYALASKWGHYFLSLGVKPGDLVALYLQNSPEFLIVWLGLLSIGAAPAAINYNLSGDALVHCLKISGANILLVDEDGQCRKNIEASSGILEQELNLKLITLDSSIKAHIGKFPDTPADEQYRTNFPAMAPSILLYTSGTTGMPKGCAFTMSRLYLTVFARGAQFNETPGPGGDRWFNSMPMYHGTAAIAMIVVLLSGIGVAIGRKFSVRNFWNDVRDSESTAFVYVGETARYLLAMPPSPQDRQHKVRFMYGNGLRPEVWEKFRERFGIAEVAEFFSSTEGIFQLLNYSRGPFLTSCVGHHGLIYRALFHNYYIPVAIDPATGDVLRDPKTGFAIRNPYAKGGEIIVAIPNITAFQGYWKNPDATEKKFLRDVFRKGDLYYRSGDALRRDTDGRWYFLDRLGDTFRWKSENVSTAEVSQVIGEFPGVIEANVYGVLVPHHEGRAGCAAIQLSLEVKGNFNFQALANHARSKLPRYAVPVFIRVVQNPSHIHNNKQNKGPLREEGVDPAKIGSRVSHGKTDRLFWLAPGKEGYVEFGKVHWDGLVSGTVKL
ncbi:hypothetical protein PVAR5_0161 [Paecilomyces variotii No. 5]|uniref:Very long-chain fatty acid transport protein n=1 Tax=Byssochlamys spectabilis (strain No. 5 / NBRC 109023) TaxID=1356009 RepID=V5F738_BYSSN|nr:hypothetical protein PVAR5_0161 [Paecilomyces variotii No. 5]